MYKINLKTGDVTKTSTGQVVCPCDSAETPDFLEYIAWCNAGNIPEEFESPIEQPINSVIAPYDFRDRFTDSEINAVLERQSTDLICAKLLLNLSTATAGVDLKSQSVIQGVNYLYSVDVLTESRKNEILDVSSDL